MILLDTNVISEMMRFHPDPRVESWFAEQTAENLFLSAVSEAELRYGVLILPVGRRRDRLSTVIDDVLHEDFVGRVLPFDSQSARIYAEIAAGRYAAGLQIDFADCQIAAIARSRKAAVATRDAKDFESCGVKIIDPWKHGDKYH